MTISGELLSLIDRGLAVFPLAPNSKIPAAKAWQATASMDPFDKLALWPEHANVGVHADGLAIIDVDRYKPNFDAAAFAALDLPPTFTVRTPRGGEHYYYLAPAGSDFGNSVSAIMPGVDVRTRGGYVVAPGSAIDGVPYMIAADLPIASLPASTAERLARPPHEAASGREASGATDEPGAVAAAVAWLATAAPANEGDGGNARTFAVACRVLDFGLSVGAAVDALAGWNDRCSPPWDDEDLARIVQNAANYRQDPIGRDNPVAALEVIQPPPNAFMRRVVTFRMTEADVAAIPPRPWLAPRRLMSGKVSVLVGVGSAGKSLIGLQWAVALALGDGASMGLAGVKRATSTLVVNNEDEPEEIHRRLAAICQHFGVPLTAVWDKIHIVSGVGDRVKLVHKPGKNGEPRPTETADEMIEAAKQLGVGSILIDPLKSIHSCNENDNSEMDEVMATLNRIAFATNCAVLVPHHTNKPPGGSSEGRAGNMDAGRGASAVRDAARINLTLFTMGKTDGEEHGIAAELRHRYVRLDDAKANLYLASPSAEWFVKRSVDLPNGEQLGVLEPVELARVSGELPAAETPAILAHLVETVRARVPLATVAVDMVKTAAWAGSDLAKLKRAIVDVLDDNPTCGIRVDKQKELKGAYWLEPVTHN